MIASDTEPFCGACNRARLTADGRLVTCLFSEAGHDLKAPLRDGTPDERIAARIGAVWRGREDRFSETRLEQIHSSGGYDATTRRKLEMIRLGG